MIQFIQFSCPFMDIYTISPMRCNACVLLQLEAKKQPSLFPRHSTFKAAEHWQHQGSILWHTITLKGPRQKLTGPAIEASANAFRCFSQRVGSFNDNNQPRGATNTTTHLELLNTTQNGFKRGHTVNLTENKGYHCVFYLFHYNRKPRLPRLGVGS